MYEDNVMNHSSTLLTDTEISEKVRIGLLTGYISAFLALMIAVVAVIGNILVLYAAFGRQKLLSVKTLRNLDTVIKSLAVTDLMIGLIGIPLRLIAVSFADLSKSDLSIGRLISKYFTIKLVQA